MESPISKRKDAPSGKNGGKGNDKQSFSTALDLGGQFLCMGEDTVGVLETGATANSVCFKWLGTRNSISETQGLPRISAYPPAVRSKSADGRPGEVHFPVDITVRIAGCKGTPTAFVLEADIPALSRKGASEAKC